MHSLFAGNALLGLLAAAAWGIGDFSGGMGVKSASSGATSADAAVPFIPPRGDAATAGSGANSATFAALRVVLASHLASFAVLLAVSLFRGDAFPQGVPLACGLAAGVAGGVSLTCFYMALSRGAMGASAAVSGLLAAAIPALFSIFSDGSPGLRRSAGFLLAGLAIWAIAGATNEPHGPNAGGTESTRFGSTMTLSISAGIGFGIYFVLLKVAGAAGVVWPMVTARVGSLTTCGLFLLMLTLRAGSSGKAPTDATKLAPKFNRKMLGWALGAALFDTSGNMLFIAATRAGRLDVAAVLASLYPASTILLAAWMLRERPSPRQGWGMLLAVGAVVLITL